MGFLRFGVHLPRCGIATFNSLSSTLRQLFKERRRWFCGGCWVRLWRRTQFSILHCRGIIARLRLRVCDGGTKKNVTERV
jgi:hypothetical protein